MASTNITVHSTIIDKYQYETVFKNTLIIKSFLSSIRTFSINIQIQSTVIIISIR
jgi:hypothetical protein